MTSVGCKQTTHITIWSLRQVGDRPKTPVEVASPTSYPQHSLYLGWLSKKPFFFAAGRPALLSAWAHARNTHTQMREACAMCVCVCLFLLLVWFAKQHFPQS